MEINFELISFVFKNSLQVIFWMILFSYMVYSIVEVYNEENN